MSQAQKLALRAKEFDSVSHPSHYNQGFIIEPIEFIMKNNLSYCVGNALKYLCRYKLKGTAKQDLEKAKQYIDFLLRELDEDE